MEAVSPVLAEVSGHSARLSQAGTCHWCNCVQTSCPISKTTFSPVASIKHTKGQDWNDAQSFLILFFLKGNLNFKFHHFCFLGWDFAWSPFFFFDSLETALNNSLICLFPHLQGEKPVMKQSHLLLVPPYQVHTSLIVWEEQLVKEMKTFDYWSMIDIISCRPSNQAPKGSFHQLPGSCAKPSKGAIYN